MKKRSDVDFGDEYDVKSYIDDIEGEVDKAYDLLNSIDSTEDLGSIEECRILLNKLSVDLY